MTCGDERLMPTGVCIQSAVSGGSYADPGFFQELPLLERAVVMVQAEVADRIALPSTKAYGAYTAKLSLFAQVTGRFEVGPWQLYASTTRQSPLGGSS